MEVLTRNGGTRTAPRVVLDPSFSFSFQVPASLLQRRVETASQAPSADEPKTPVHVNEAAEEEEDSWEDRDWSTPVNVEREMALRVVKDEALEEDWEEADLNELADDFPVLIVDLTRLRDVHFRADGESGGHVVTIDTEEEVRAFYQTVKATLHEHFTQMTEVLFDQELCFHSTYGAQRLMLESLHRAYPTHVFALVDYPTELAGLELHEYLHVLSNPTRWPSVNYLKDCLRRCSRDLEWKFEIAIELERLAAQEHERYTREQQALSDEIDDLTRLRDSFREKLEQIQRDTENKAAQSSQYLLLRKVEDLENRLMTLLDTYLAEPELTEAESRDLLGFMDASPSMQMRNVLDMVVAMIFSRLPRDYGTQPTQETHFEMLLDHHMHIRRLWKKDFGRLPARSGATEEKEDVDKAEVVDEPMYHEEELDTYPIEDEPIGLAEDFQEVLRISHDEDDDDDFEVVPMEEDAQSETVPSSAGSGEAQTVVDDLDGYGGDYESNESDVEEVSITSPTSSSTRPQPPRRRRRRKTRKTGESKASPIDSDDELALFRGKAADSDEEDRRPFQPFACTGAIGLLRAAKENELF
ncbi:hypothetical protein Poli38472_009246 [Pythium oligandrum]|uniref:Uncharacterized protein n=1 Tax=Pythium oligandrum TaxID=41045 RepID=A0A8K1CK86_PYTOL|nr:hypothetical protein Poli38472_009246 [Pythium oligandrum]|eukprot:TMW65079.1 hypothetical protein Poli38472_009246 [Pythium oligandrum]